jgi:Lon protease-like protein
MARRNYWSGRVEFKDPTEKQKRVAEVDYPGLDNLHKVTRKTNRHNEIGAVVKFTATGDYQSVTVEMSAKLAVADEDFFDGGPHSMLAELCAERALNWIEALEEGWIPEYGRPERRGFQFEEEPDVEE